MVMVDTLLPKGSRPRAAATAAPSCQSIDELAEGREAGALRVVFGQAGEAIGVREQAAKQTDEVVAGSALDRPIGAQVFACGKDLLHDDVGVADGFAQPNQVGVRIAQSIDMIDAHAFNESAQDQLERERVRDLEDIAILDPHTGQVGDVEEATIVDPPGAAPPELQAIRLLAEDAFQLGRLVDGVERGLQRGFDAGHIRDLLAQQ
jgi:hypothetical protein